MNKMFDFRPISKKELTAKFPRLKIVKQLNVLF